MLQEGISRGASAKAVADLFGLATRMLRRWGLMIRAQGFRETLENQVDPRDNFLVIAGYGSVHGRQAARIR
jgi:hypothetical protein